MINKQFIITPKAVNAKWRKDRKATIVDEDFGGFSRGITYFLDVKGIKGLVAMDGNSLLTHLKNKTIIPL